ncbi:fungal-specific transcription factor domain-containing protein [Geopyxis carbonaria]|nr:fungal-specific transcription factor domain-containing protein [Geopyxis carbonaria]
MVRPLLPKQEEASPNGFPPTFASPTGSGGSGGSPGKVVKRRCISSACIPCRRRKSKCDGASPACSTCKAVYQMECVYDSDGDRRRKSTGSSLNSATKKEKEQMDQTKDAPVKGEGLDDVVSRLRDAPSWPEVSSIVDHLKTHGNMQGYSKTDGDPAEITKMGQASSDNHRDVMISNQISQDIGVLEVDRLGNLRHFGRRSSLELIHSDIGSQFGMRSPNRDLDVWTTVTNDENFISELLYLYFTWHHPIHLLVSKSCFLSDMHKHRSKYCSSLLVNALLALACHYSSRLEARSDPSDPSTNGAHFFAEAKRLLLEEEDHPSTTVAQALALMSLRETGCGHDSSAWMYSGRAFRVALDLGLNLDAHGANIKYSFTHTENEVRHITFWGLFVLDKVLSMQFGRIPQLPNAIVGIPKPTILPTIDAEPWPITPSLPGHLQTVAEQYYTLAEIIGDALEALHSPRCNYALPALQTLQRRLEAWASCQPSFLSPDAPAASPAILTLPILYHSTLLLIHRPFTHLPFLSARTHCAAAANTITSLVRKHLDRHTHAAVALLAHLLLSAASVLIEDHNVHTDTLRTCITGLHRISQVWPGVAEQTLRGVQHHAEQWGVNLPSPVEEDPMPPPYSSCLDDVSSVPRNFAYTTQEQDVAAAAATDEFMKSLEHPENWAVEGEAEAQAEAAVMGLLAGDVGMGAMEGIGVSVSVEGQGGFSI